MDYKFDKEIIYYEHGNKITGYFCIELFNPDKDLVILYNYFSNIKGASCHAYSNILSSKCLFFVKNKKFNLLKIKKIKNKAMDFIHSARECTKNTKILK